MPIDPAGGAVNINAATGFSRCSTSMKSEQVLCIRVKTLGVDNACGFHPATLADLDKEMSQFGKQQGSGAKYAAITLPYSMHPCWQTLAFGSQTAEYAALLSSHVEAVITMLNKDDYLLQRYLAAAEDAQDKQCSENVRDLCVKLRTLQVSLLHACPAKDVASCRLYAVLLSVASLLLVLHMQPHAASVEKHLCR